MPAWNTNTVVVPTCFHERAEGLFPYPSEWTCFLHHSPHDRSVRRLLQEETIGGLLRRWTGYVAVSQIKYQIVSFLGVKAPNLDMVVSIILFPLKSDQMPCLFGYC